jgi:hypothetical protein
VVSERSVGLTYYRDRHGGRDCHGVLSTVVDSGIRTLERCPGHESAAAGAAAVWSCALAALRLDSELQVAALET